MAQDRDSENESDEQSEDWEGNRRSRRVRIVFGIVSVLVLTFLLLGRINFFIRPEKTQFTLQDITLHDFNVSVDPSLLSSNFQVTISSHNPNPHIGMYYDNLVGYASYWNQQVTSRTDIPATYQGHKNSYVWTVLISGTSVPIAPYIGAALSRDWGHQVAAIVIKLEGQVRWKLGILTKVISVKYQLFQRCDVDFSK